MEDTENDFCGHELLAESSLGAEISGSLSMESFFDEILKSTHACTHTHTCNPPGPDNTHTHTCFHTHTHLFAATEGEKSSEKSDNRTEPSSSSSKKQRPLGNREAVRKYREKKKAHTAHLEEEVNQLRALNQQLVRRLQGHAALEAEILRLRSLLAEFKGRIEAELGSNRYQKCCLGRAVTVPKDKEGFSEPLPGGYSLNSVNLPCDADVPCLHSSFGSQKDSLMQQQNSHSPRVCGYCDTEAEMLMGSMSQNNGLRDEETDLGAITTAADGTLSH
eukprot:c21066_g1_i1 orf=235-1062(+)